MHSTFAWPPLWWHSRSRRQIWASLRDATAGDGRLLPVGVRAIDEALLGGLRSGTCTEVSGPAGSGKTQFVLSLIAELMTSAVAQGTLGNFGVLVVYSEGSFPAERLAEMISSRLGDPEVVQVVFSCIFVETVSDPQEFWKVLTERLPKIMTTVKIELLVVDSIAGLFRELPVRDPTSAIATRARNLSCVTTLLRAILYRGDSWAVMTNQVTGRAQGTTAALGLCWRHMPDVRVSLYRHRPFTHHSFTVLQHPLVGHSTAWFSVSASGIVEAPVFGGRDDANAEKSDCGYTLN